MSSYRRKAIILMNNETRYSGVIYRPSNKNFSKIRELVYKGITETLRLEDVRKEVIEAYMAIAGEISFFKTARKSMIAKMNNAVREIEFMQYYLNEETKI